MNKKRYHVTKTAEGWKGALENSQRASVVGTNKEDVLGRTIEIAKNYGHSQVIIHKQEGNRIQEERTYPRSSDPKTTKG